MESLLYDSGKISLNPKTKSSIRCKIKDYPLEKTYVIRISDCENVVKLHGDSHSSNSKDRINLIINELNKLKERLIIQ
tara:strand:+ start:605 stop:838 length:234 start_codon:yes stop_codon:yes gene_type:complete